MKEKPKKEIPQNINSSTFYKKKILHFFIFSQSKNYGTLYRLFSIFRKSKNSSTLYKKHIFLNRNFKEKIIFTYIQIFLEHFFIYLKQKSLKNSFIYLSKN